MGITPACAGKSLPCSVRRNFPKDHPRVCGEKGLASGISAIHLGSPPRVRGKDLNLFHFSASVRITPACAGKSLMQKMLWRMNWDHPRVCGEKTKKIP